ncbi:MAG: hypothetical protein IKX56_06780 [Muribaculaceae bacterium]|nr:hypothetical protein [Muribaculaceae bacterium]
MKKLLFLLFFVSLQLTVFSGIRDVSCPLDNPTPSQINEWINEYKSFCSSKINQMSVGYTIPKEMIQKDPCLVYLVLTAESLDNKKERQEWFDLYPSMTKTQIMKLYGIFYREKHELRENENRYFDNTITEISCPLEDPTPYQITKWANKYKDFCSNNIERLSVGFDIPNTMIQDDPCLVYLVLTAESYETKEERQEWFDLYPLMTEDQIMKLYSILYGERHKLEKIEAKYLDQISQQNSNIKNVSCPLEDPTPYQITKWAKKYKDFCSNKINQLGAGYSIPNSMIQQDPCLVYLVLTAESLDNKKERQKWFDLYPLMDEPQIYKLYRILYREKHSLDEIRSKKN